MIVGEAVLGQLSASCDDQPLVCYTDHVLSYPSRSLDGSDESKEANFLQAGRSSFQSSRSAKRFFCPPPHPCYPFLGERTFKQDPLFTPQVEVRACV